MYGKYHMVGIFLRVQNFRGFNFTVSESGVHVLVGWMAKS